jgi:hypothetical protein
MFNYLRLGKDDDSRGDVMLPIISGREGDRIDRGRRAMVDALNAPSALILKAYAQNLSKSVGGIDQGQITQLAMCL